MKNIPWCLRWSQRVLVLVLLVLLADPATAQLEVGENDFHVSSVPFNLGDLDTSAADVAYNSTDHEFLVVFEGDAPANFCNVLFPIRTIFARRIDASTGALIDENIVPVSRSCDNLREAFEPEVAYNSAENEYLAVWHADDDTVRSGTEGLGTLDIFGQLLSADLTLVGSEAFRISDMQNPANPNGVHPAVVYNSVDNEYLVVWHGDDEVQGDNEIFGQRLNENGTAQGLNDFRISDMGGTGNTKYYAFSPAVAYNPTENEYLVVWRGSDDVGGLAFSEFEIFGQRLDGNGEEQGANDFRISDMGGTGDNSYKASDPAVTYNSGDNEYLVVWLGDDDVGGLVDGELEIFGQRLDGNGDELGANDFRISDMGGTGDNPYDAFHPAVTYNAVDNEYLVVWDGDDDVGGLVDGEFEIFGQRLGGNGDELGANDFRISDMGGTGDVAFEGAFPDVAYNPVDNESLVAWEGDDNVGGPLVDDEFEIFGQRLAFPIFQDGIFHDGFE